MKSVAPMVWLDRIANASGDSILVFKDEVEAVVQRLLIAEEVVRLAGDGKVAEEGDAP